MKLLTPLFTAGLFVTGCAGTVPAEKISATESSIRAAEEQGAPKVPQASLHLQLAKEETEHAQKFMKEGEPKRAEGLLLRAQADAELALALARDAPLKTEAQGEMDKARTLQQQANQ